MAETYLDGFSNSGAGHQQSNSNTATQLDFQHPHQHQQHQHEQHEHEHQHNPQGPETATSMALDTLVTTATTTTTTTTNNNNNINPTRPHQAPQQFQNSFDTIDNEASELRAPYQGLQLHRQSQNPSKLPGFTGTTDFKTGSASSPVSLLHRQRPPSPISPTTQLRDTTTQESVAGGITTTTASIAEAFSSSSNYHDAALSAAPVAPVVSPPQSNNHSRASSNQLVKSPTAIEPSFYRASLPAPSTETAVADETPLGLRIPPDITSKPEQQQAHSSFYPADPLSTSVSSSATETAHQSTFNPPSSLDTTQSQESSSLSREQADGQRELLLVKSLSRSSPQEDKRHSSYRPPPVSYKPHVSSPVAPSGTAAPIRVPPIRGFRSSGSRKSMVLDLNTFDSRSLESGDETPGSGSGREYSFRSAEARPTEENASTAASMLATDRVDAEDSDVFLRIAREESLRRRADDRSMEDAQSTIRPFRATHRRPLSNAVISPPPNSPPRVGRRLSQNDEVTTRRWEDDRPIEVPRSSTQRSYSRDKIAIIPTPAEDGLRARAGSSSRQAPVTPRNFQDPGSETGAYSRRRPSIGDTNPPLSRSSMFKSPSERHQQPKTYYLSSPLVRTFDLPAHQAQAEPSGHVEGTESTTSNTAPSTVWDELDDLKSRIHRLELTGKLPSTSAAAVSRMSDERPPTATTAATTMSASPKRSAIQGNDAVSTTSSQRENHPILTAALAKSKPFLTPEVWSALEAAANDAIDLSSMMGLPGHPGPISSGASTIGGGTNVTDRQLRRKADSVCRSLTELCLALGEDVAKTKLGPPPPSQPQTHSHSRSNSMTRPEPTTPTIKQTFTPLPSSRRPSVAVAEEEPALPQLPSPRVLSKFEERRNIILNGNTLPSPQALQYSNSSPATPGDAITQTRRSSLFIGRTRKADTEEPEDGRRSSMMLRSRRAGTEEPDEGRKTSLLIRNRRGTGDGADDELRARAPSRAVTEVHTTATLPLQKRREYGSQNQTESTPQQSTPPAPRRRFASSSVQPSRLATPAISASNPQRKYLDRSALDREEQQQQDRGVSEDRGTRHLSMNMSAGQNVVINRSSTLHTRRNRESGIIPPSSTYR